MSKFQIDPKRKLEKQLLLTKVDLHVELHRWIKAVAAVNDVTIPCVINQAVEYARKNSERISL